MILQVHYSGAGVGGLLRGAGSGQCTASAIPRRLPADSVGAPGASGSPGPARSCSHLESCQPAAQPLPAAVFTARGWRTHRGRIQAYAGSLQHIYFILWSTLVHLSLFNGKGRLFLVFCFLLSQYFSIRSDRSFLSSSEIVIPVFCLLNSIFNVVYLSWSIWSFSVLLFNVPLWFVAL